MPEVCYREHADAPLQIGSEARSIIIRQRSINAVQNDEKRSCRMNYLAYQAAISGTLK